MEVRFPMVAKKKLDGVITEWHADEGAVVNVKDRLVSYETSKMASDIYSPAHGRLHRLVERGGSVKYDQPFAIIDEEDRE